MNDFLLLLVMLVYFVSSCGLVIFSLNCYIMLALFMRNRHKAAARRRLIESQFGNLLSDGQDVPHVTTQIAVYNELNVVERIMRAACQMIYAPGRHEIQVLDDSNDETSELVDRLTAELRSEGHDIKVLRRSKRIGFKAGALDHGMKRCAGELIAVFDADFVPPPDFLLRTVPYFLADARLGLAQARWGHLNREGSLLTQAQAIGIDGHFMIEQSARNFSGLFMNFNGTAGIWRKSAIENGGGWQWDTLTEDMDLSYRVQFAGWNTVYLPDLVVPAEIPEDVSAFKSQQFRWAKGSIQTAIKLLPSLLKSPVSPFKKIEAIFHMTHYLVHPMMLIMAILALPMLLHFRFSLNHTIMTVIALALGLSMLAPSTLYAASQKAAYPDWGRRLLRLPILIVVGVGIAVSNTRAVGEALLGISSDFIRTPKKGDKVLKHYSVQLPWLAGLEIVLGAYCTYSLGVYLETGKYLIGPFLGIYAAGFLYIGLLSLMQRLGRMPWR